MTLGDLRSQSRPPGGLSNHESLGVSWLLGTCVYKTIFVTLDSLSPDEKTKWNRVKIDSSGVMPNSSWFSKLTQKSEMYIEGYC